MASTTVGTLAHPHPNEAFWRTPNWVSAVDVTAASSATALTMPSTNAGLRFLRITGNFDYYISIGSTGVTTASTQAGGASIYVPVQSGGRCFDIASTVATTAIAVMSTAASHICVEGWAP